MGSYRGSLTINNVELEWWLGGGGGGGEEWVQPFLVRGSLSKLFTVCPSISQFFCLSCLVTCSIKICKKSKSTVHGNVFEAIQLTKPPPLTYLEEKKRKQKQIKNTAKKTYYLFVCLFIYLFIYLFQFITLQLNFVKYTEIRHF